MRRSDPVSSTMKLAEYLFTRLRQLDIGSVHGVPGDYNLTLLDYIEPAGLRWVGNANELNAGYAADGYARIKGVGALVTTFGVGELSAINAIAGAYAERAAVVHIVGTPGRPSQDSRALVHHTFNDGDYRRFAQMQAHVTVAQTSLRDPRTSPEQIDEVLRQCLLHSRPVYIEVPVDLVSAPVSADRLKSEIVIPNNIPTPEQDAAVEKVLERIYASRQPLILVDGEVRAFGIVDEVQELVKTTQWPTWTLQYAKGLIDETPHNVHGIWRGKYDDSRTKKFMEQADLVLCFGPHFSNTNSYAYTSIPNPDIAIYFKDTEVTMGADIFRDIPAKVAITALLQKLDHSRVRTYDPYPDLPRDYLMSFKDVSDKDLITQDKFYRILGHIVRPGDIVMGETGSPGYGCRDMPLPSHARMFTPVTWLSIGYMLPAAQGAALAQRELMEAGRYHGIKNACTILIIGDGSFQMTAQELGTIIKLKLDVTVFLINNDGYTIERCIHGRNQVYNDVTRWRYLKAPALFGAGPDTYTASATTWGQLETVIGSQAVKDGRGLRMVEVIMDSEDFPEGQLLDMLNKQKLSEPAQNGVRGE